MILKIIDYKIIMLIINSWIIHKLDISALKIINIIHNIF